MIESLTQSRISTAAAVSLFLVLIFSVLSFLQFPKSSAEAQTSLPVCVGFPPPSPGVHTSLSIPTPAQENTLRLRDEEKVKCFLHVCYMLIYRCPLTAAPPCMLVSFWGILCNLVYIHLCPRRSEGSDVVLGASGKNDHPAPEPGLAGCKTQDRVRSDGRPYLLPASLCLYYSVWRCCLFYSVFF